MIISKNDSGTDHNYVFIYANWSQVAKKNVKAITKTLKFLKF